MKNFTLLVLAAVLTVSAPFSSMAQEVAAHAEKAFLGMYFTHVTPEKALTMDVGQPYGGLASSIFEGSPADRAGLKKGDYVIAIDENVTSESQNLQNVIELYKPCDQVVVTYIRNGQEFSATTILTKRPPQEYFRGGIKGNQAFLGTFFGYRHEGEGLNVSRVVENSTAQEMGLLRYDIVTHINGQKVEYVSDVRTALADVKAGAQINVDLIRNEKPMSVSAQMKTKAETYMYIECEQPEDLADLSEEELAELQEKTALESTPGNLGIGSVNFFPNPSNGQFDLMFNLYDVGDVNIQIFNGNGQLVYSEQIAGFSGYFNGNVDISNNAKGIYFLIVEQNGKSVSKKVVLQ